MDGGQSERRKGVSVIEARVWSMSQMKNLKEGMINSSNTVEANRNDRYLVTARLFMRHHFSFVNSLAQI